METANEDGEDDHGGRAGGPVDGGSDGRERPGGRRQWRTRAARWTATAADVGGKDMEQLVMRTRIADHCSSWWTPLPRDKHVCSQATNQSPAYLSRPGSHQLVQKSYVNLVPPIIVHDLTYLFIN
jgi:hypothetical protein